MAPTEFVEDVEANEAPLREQLELLEDLAEDWPPEKVESAKRRVQRLFHQGMLRRSAIRYNLKPNDVERCLQQLAEKFPD